MITSEPNNGCEKGTPKQTCCCAGKPASGPGRISSEINSADRWGAVMCRLSNRFRMRYRVDPGLYALGNPDASSPVFVSANYRLSFNALRGSLENINGWILVLDTKGINVWCAAGKGTFGTAEIINRIKMTGLSSKVSHRTLIVPQLGAPGIAAHEVKKETGFAVIYGPVHSRDIKDFLAAGNRATPAMRRMDFAFRDRIVLIPMELFPALKKFLWVILGCLVIMGIQPRGILFRDALIGSFPLIAAGIVAVIAGTVVTPALLPVIPFRSFAIKGALAGAGLISPVLFFFKHFFPGYGTLTAAVLLFFTAVSSYLALNFTGCTTFTSMSGVKKEMRFAVPAYLAVCGIATVLIIVYKLQEWSIL